MSYELKYLIIEDSLKVCEGITERMELFAKWTACKYAHHVNDAKIIAAKERPQLIFIDWSLKGGSAYEVLQFIEHIPNYHPYIIFNTGYQSENPEIPQEIINNYKIDKYVVKPLWENLRKNLSLYLDEAEKKFKANSTAKEIWFTDTNRKKVHANLYDLMWVCQSMENAYYKNLYLNKQSVLTVKISWRDIIELLYEHQIDFFITNSRQHLVVKKYIDSYQRPFVKLKSIPHKIEVVKERLHEFEEWL